MKLIPKAPHQTKQILMHSHMLNSIPEQYDMIIRARWDLFIKNNSIPFEKFVEESKEENKAIGFSRKLSNNPAEKYIPQEDKEGNLCTETEKYHPRECDLVKTEYTLLSNPPCNLRGTGWNRWEWLCQDPQANVITPYYFGTDTKQLAKDLHRPCVPMPFKEHGLPVASNQPLVEEVEPVDAVPIGPVSVSWQNLNNIKQY